tara:strand:+ start:3520 stop:3873 length:354 start_codon:yes stop_codon:yes gene_type:complete
MVCTITLKKGVLMNFYDLMKEDLSDNIGRLYKSNAERSLLRPGSSLSTSGVCRIIYIMSDLKRGVFCYNLLALVIALKGIGYTLAMFFVLFNLYLFVVFGCLIDDQCYAMHYGGYHG